MPESMRLKHTLCTVSFCLSLPIIGHGQNAINSPYLFESFAQGTIITHSGKQLPSLINYHTLKEKMYLEKDNFQITADKRMQIDSIKILSRTFVSVEDLFYELLIEDEVSLFKQHKTTLSDQAVDTGYGTGSKTSGNNKLTFSQSSLNNKHKDIPAGYELIDASIYWIYYKNEFSSFKTIKQLVKIFPAHKNQLKSFTKENKINFTQPQGVIQIINYTNSIL